MLVYYVPRRRGSIQYALGLSSVLYFSLSNVSLMFFRAAEMSTLVRLHVVYFTFTGNHSESDLVLICNYNV